MADIQHRNLRISLAINDKPLADYTLVAVREKLNSGIWEVYDGAGGSSYGKVESPYGSPFETLAARALRLVINEKHFMPLIERTNTQ